MNPIHIKNGRKKQDTKGAHNGIFPSKIYITIMLFNRCEGKHTHTLLVILYRAPEISVFRLIAYIDPNRTSFRLSIKS